MSSYNAPVVRVYLLDDHDLVRRGLRDLVVAAKDIDVVGDTASAMDAIAEIGRHDVDVAVLDLQLQDGTGVEVARRVRSADPRIQVLLLTSASDDDALVATVLAGAAGYVVKLASTSDIVGSIRRLASGRRLLTADLMARAATLVEERRRSLSPPLTELEEQLLSQVLAGHTDAVIAESLRMDPPELSSAVSEFAHRLTFPRQAPTASPPTARPAAGRHRRST